MAMGPFDLVSRCLGSQVRRGLSGRPDVEQSLRWADDRDGRGTREGRAGGIRRRAHLTRTGGWVRLAEAAAAWREPRDIVRPSWCAAPTRLRVRPGARTADLGPKLRHTSAETACRCPMQRPRWRHRLRTRHDRVRSSTAWPVVADATMSDARCRWAPVRTGAATVAADDVVRALGADVADVTDRLTWWSVATSTSGPVVSSPKGRARRQGPPLVLMLPHGETRARGTSSRLPAPHPQGSGRRPAGHGGVSGRDYSIAAMAARRQRPGRAARRGAGRPGRPLARRAGRAAGPPRPGPGTPARARGRRDAAPAGARPTGPPGRRAGVDCGSWSRCARRSTTPTRLASAGPLGSRADARGRGRPTQLRGVDHVAELVAALPLGGRSPSTPPRGARIRPGRFHP